MKTILPILLLAACAAAPPPKPAAPAPAPKSCLAEPPPAQVKLVVMAEPLKTKAQTADGEEVEVTVLPVHTPSFAPFFLWVDGLRRWADHAWEACK